MDDLEDLKRKYAVWIKEKQREEVLRKHNYFEEMIIELRKYDKELFNQDRRYHEWNYELFDFTLMNMTYTPYKEIITYQDLIDIIDDPDVYQRLKDVDLFEQRILTLRLQGYSFNDISKILHVNINTLYSRYKKIKKLVKASKKLVFLANTR